MIPRESSDVFILLKNIEEPHSGGVARVTWRRWDRKMGQIPGFWKCWASASCDYL